MLSGDTFFINPLINLYRYNKVFWRTHIFFGKDSIAPPRESNGVSLKEVYHTFSTHSQERFWQNVRLKIGIIILG